MSTKSTARRALRLSRPDTEQFFGVMLVFSRRTFSWTLTRKTLLWTLGLVFGFSALAMIGSAYGFWATKKLMSFSQLQRETRSQQLQLRQALDQAGQLQDELGRLTQQMNDLGQVLDTKSSKPSLPPPPGTQPMSVPPPSGGAPAGGGNHRVQQLRTDLEKSTAQAKLIRARMEPIIERWNHTPSIWPTAGYLSSGFGLRISPFARRNEADDGLLGYHSGYDISNSEGTPIQATADGVVEVAGWYERYGNAVILKHSSELGTLYGHMSRVDVRPGQRVSRGDILGAMGRTGAATGVHLHYEVRVNGHPVNPQPYLHLQRQWLSTLKR